MTHSRAAKLLWFTMLIVAVGTLFVYLGALGGLGTTGSLVFELFFPIGFACLALLILFFTIKEFTTVHPSKLVGLFLMISVIDHLILKYSVYLIGYFVFALIYSHGIAILVGLIYYWKKLRKLPH